MPNTHGHSVTMNTMNTNTIVKSMKDLEHELAEEKKKVESLQNLVKNLESKLAGGKKMKKISLSNMFEDPYEKEYEMLDVLERYSL